VCFKTFFVFSFFKRYIRALISHLLSFLPLLLIRTQKSRWLSFLHSTPLPLPPLPLPHLPSHREREDSRDYVSLWCFCFSRNRRWYSSSRTWRTVKLIRSYSHRLQAIIDKCCTSLGTTIRTSSEISYGEVLLEIGVTSKRDRCG
jgi:hypothetical protein